MRPQGSSGRGHFHYGCVLICAVVVVVGVPFQALAQPATVPAVVEGEGLGRGEEYQPVPTNPIDRLKLRWSEVCNLAVTDGRLAVRCDLSLDALKSLDGSEMQIKGMPGGTSVAIQGRKYVITNLQQVGEKKQELRLTSSRYGLALELNQSGPGGNEFEVLLSQGSNEYNRRSGRGNEVRLIAEAGSTSVNVEASDFVLLRKEYP